MKKNWPAFLLVLVVLLAGGYLRVAHLGRDDFGADELFHVYAAESLRQGDGPRLPSGDLYTRGIDITRLVELSTGTLGPGEETARLPSAILGIIDLCLFAAVLWALGGGWTAFWGTFLLALYPEAIAQSRAVRFYTYQLAFGVIALYSGWRALARSGARATPDRREIVHQWLWVAITLGALALAIRIQIVTLSVVAGWGACVVLAAVADLRARGPRNWTRSVPLQLVCGATMAGLLLLLLEPDVPLRILRLSQHLPAWARAAGTRDPLVYARGLFASFPVLVALGPLIYLALAFSRPRLAIYLLTWFVIPFLAHSFVFPWKGQRFILLAVPAFFAAAGLAAAMGAGALRVWISRRLKTTWGTRRHEALAIASMATVCLFLVATTPALIQGWKKVSSNRDLQWQRMASILQSRSDLRGLPVGTTAPLHALYYLGGVDFVANVDARRSETDRHPEEQESDGVADFQAGVPILATPAGIRTRFNGKKAVLIGTDSAFIAKGRIDPALARVLDREAEELCSGRCGAGLLYLWRYEPEPSEEQVTRSPGALGPRVNSRPTDESLSAPTDRAIPDRP